MGPHAPYDEWIYIEVRLKMSKDMKTVWPAVRVHNDDVRLEPYKHTTKGFDVEFEYMDAVCSSFNNTRP
jgi:hypothetical protein